jgi:hypothetical protein
MVPVLPFRGVSGKPLRFTREEDFAQALDGPVEAPAVVEEQESSAAPLLLVRSRSERGLGGNASFRERARLVLRSFGATRVGERRSGWVAVGRRRILCVR